MVTKIPVRDKNISVELVPHIVRIKTDDQLIGLLQHNTRKATEELVVKIKAEYKRLFGADLKISRKSMVVEIWGHVYGDLIAIWIKKVSSIRLINKAANFVISRAEVIDSGEMQCDYNRFVWDALAVFEPVIALFLPK